MPTMTNYAARITLPSDTELVITREFNAPRALVFETLTKPEHVKRWWGLRRMPLTTCEIDLQPGGAWRYVSHDPNSGQDFAFSGVYREIAPPERIVSTEWFEGIPADHAYLVTTTLTERDGKTTLRSHLKYKSREDRDGHVQSGMEHGMNETFDRLAELLATMS
jgi:uncharacterized protein YndB with AHSA1/START domain